MSNPDKFSEKSLFPRTPLRLLLYGMVVGSLIIPSLIDNYHQSGNFFCHSCDEYMNSTQTSFPMDQISYAQVKYFKKYQKFSQSLFQLQSILNQLKNSYFLVPKLMPETKYYSYRIVQPMPPVAEWKKPVKIASFFMVSVSSKSPLLLNYLLVLQPNYRELISSESQKSLGIVRCGNYKTLSRDFRFNWPTGTMSKIITGEILCPPKSSKKILY